MIREELESRRRILKESARGAGEALSPMNVVEKHQRQTWPSGIAAVDKLAGGFYGLAVVAGAQKLGKSIAGTRSMLEAAKDGWTVFCFHGENDSQTMGERFVNYFGSPFRTWPDWYERITMRRIGPTATLERIADFVADHLTENDENILILIDSANRLAKRISANTKVGYFDALQRIVDWATEVVSLSKGSIGVMLISELNRAGKAVGMDIEYAASTTLYLRGEAVDDEVELQLVSRRTPGGKLGLYRRKYLRCEFVPMSDHADTRDEPDPWPPGELERALDPAPEQASLLHLVQSERDGAK